MRRPEPTGKGEVVGPPVSETFEITGRTRVRRHDDRASYDRATAYSIIDEALYCHVGFLREGGPTVIPTIHARDGDRLFLHGSPASTMLRTLSAGVDVCIAITLLDGLVLARSVFNHSMNYRSVIIYGRAAPLTDPDEKLRSMEILTERVLPGRWADARHPSDSEFRTTLMLAVPLEEASIKSRSGPPEDEAGDYNLDVWAGVIPLRLCSGEPIPDPRLAPGIETPDYVIGYRRSTTQP